MERTELTYIDSKSSKFWNIKVSGCTHTVTYGRIGSTGQTLEKEFPSEDAAHRAAEKLTRQKRAKGYVDGAKAGADAGEDGAIKAGKFFPSQNNNHVEREAFHQKIGPKSLHPIGSHVENAEDIDVFYYPVDHSVDQEWIDLRFPSSPKTFYDLLQEAFKQYCGDDWCGASMRDEVIAELREDSEDQALLFEKEGYPPFFHIDEIRLNPKVDTVIISGSTIIDCNLDEHGVCIVEKKGEWKFGYGDELSNFFADNEELSPDDEEVPFDRGKLSKFGKRVASLSESLDDFSLDQMSLFNNKEDFDAAKVYSGKHDATVVMGNWILNPQLTYEVALAIAEDEDGVQDFVDERTGTRLRITDQEWHLLDPDDDDDLTEHMNYKVLNCNDQVMSVLQGSHWGDGELFCAVERYFIVDGHLIDDIDMVFDRLTD